MTDKEWTQDYALEAALCQLGEHFDNVQIIVTTRVAGQTIGYRKSRGNGSAIYGEAKRFVIEEEERRRQLTREEAESEKRAEEEE